MGGGCSSSTTNATKDNNTITFNTLSAGTYSNCTITVMDNANNMSAPLAVSSFTVTSSSSDTTKPQITGLSFSPSSIDTSSSSQTVTATISITDDTALPDSGYLNVTVGLRSPSQNQNIYFNGNTGQEETGGTSVSRTFKSTSTFPQGSESGTWTVNYSSVKDRVGNTKSYTASELTALGFSTTISNTPSSGDTTAPTASVTTATIPNTGNAVVQSTETGTAYLVKTTVSVSNLASITGAADSQWNSVAISSASTNTNLAATGLVDGTYKVYAVDALGNLSSASTNSVTLDTTAPTVTFNPANGATEAASRANITITFNEAVRLLNNDDLTDSNVDSLITLRQINASGAIIGFDATINDANTIITINPSATLPTIRDIYVAIGATVEDSADNAITASDATFKTCKTNNALPCAE